MNTINPSDFSEKLRTLINAKYKKNTDFYRAFERRYNKSIENSCKQWLKGSNYPKIDNLIDLCDILDCDFEYFLTQQEEFKRTDKTISDLLGLSVRSIKTLEQLDNNHIDFLNFILADVKAFYSFLTNLMLYINNEYTIPIHQEYDKETTNYTYVVYTANKAVTGESFIEIGKKNGEFNGQPLYDVIGITTDILETHALNKIHIQLEEWKTQYKKKGSDE